MFDETVQGPDVDKAIEWRKGLHVLLDTRDAQGISGKAWFDIDTKIAGTHRIKRFFLIKMNFMLGKTKVHSYTLSPIPGGIFHS